MEQVNHPAHYNQGSIECIDAIQAALTPEEFIGFLKGQQLKYVWRAGHKSSSDILTDIKKAEWYGLKLFSFVAARREREVNVNTCALTPIEEIESPEYFIQYFPVYPKWLEGIIETAKLEHAWVGSGWYVIEAYEDFATIVGTTDTYEEAQKLSIELDKTCPV